MPFFRRKPFHLPVEPIARTPVPIVAEGAISSTTLGDGRLIPVLILDTSNRPDIDEFVRVHQHLPPGDVVTQWGCLAGSKDIVLFLSFRKPMEITVIIKFEMDREAILIEHVEVAHSLYMQGGKPGDRLKDNIEAPKILVEVPDTGFGPIWNKIFKKAVIRKFRTEGVSRQQAKIAADLYIAEHRKFTARQIPRK